MIARLFVILSLLAAFHAHSDETVKLAPVSIESDVDKQANPLVYAPGSVVHKDRDQVREKTPSSLNSAIGFEPNIEFSSGPRDQAMLPNAPRGRSATMHPVVWKRAAQRQRPARQVSLS